ncbi:MAG: hypothetical protein ACK4NF_03145 [Planctomycetota bacterium]
MIRVRKFQYNFLHENLSFWGSIVIIQLLSAASAGVLIWYFPMYPGVSPDSVIYIEGAENLYTTFEYKSKFIRWLWEGGRDENKAPQQIVESAITNKKEWITDFPPGTSFIYHLTYYISSNILKNIKVINIVFFIFLVLSFLFIIYFETGNLWLTILLFFYLVFTLPFIEKFYWAWSEPLYVLFNFLSFFTLIKFIETKKQSFFILSIIVTTIGCSIRFQGIANVISGLIVLLLYNREYRLKRALMWGLTSSLFFLIDFFYLKTLARGTRYRFHFYPQTIPNLEGNLDIFLHGLLTNYLIFSAENRNFLRTLFFDGAFIIFLFIIILSCFFNRGFKFTSCAIYIVMQCMIIIISGIVFNAGAPERYVMPLFPLAGYWFGKAVDVKNFYLRKILQGLLLLFLILILPLKFFDFYKIRQINRDDGLWYSGSSSRNSAILSYLSHLKIIEKNFYIFSNDAFLAYNSLFNMKLVMYPLPYKRAGFEKFFELTRDMNYYIIWDTNTEGLPIFDTSSKKVITFEYKQAFLDSFPEFTKMYYLPNYLIYGKKKND